MSQHPTPVDKRAAEADIAAMRQRLREAVNTCTDLAMDQAVLILDNHRLRRLLNQSEKDCYAAQMQRREATSLLEYALHLRQHGEKAPGGSETWRQFDTRAEDFLRTHGAAAALSAVTVKEWADIAYEMWALICDSEAIEGQNDWEQAKNRLRVRFHAALDALPDSAKIENEEKR